MDIEKLNENQVKIVLSKSDLQERDINIGELAYGSEKTQELFREMMMQAMVQCDFHTDNTPLMIEAIPAQTDGIVIIVTKVTSPNDIENKFNLFSNQKENTKKRTKNEPRKKTTMLTKDFALLYSFSNLNVLVNVANRIQPSFFGESSVFKYENNFYLLLEETNKINISEENFESLLSEYGDKHISTFMSKYFLKEHGEEFIKSDAISVLVKYL